MNQVKRINYRIEYRVIFELVRFIINPTLTLPCSPSIWNSITL